MQLNEHAGKVGVLCLAPSEDLGIEDRGMREQIGEARLRLFRDHANAAAELASIERDSELIASGVRSS